MGASLISGVVLAMTAGAVANGPWETYYAYVAATINAKSLSEVESYLTPEGRAQVRDWPEDARREALKSLSLGFNLLDLKPGKVTIQGPHAALDVIGSVRSEAQRLSGNLAAGQPRTIRGQVEMALSEGRWRVRSETYAGHPTEAETWTGLRAPGVFPTDYRALVETAEYLEKTAVDDIKTVISTEAAYQGVNNDYYDRIECLARPSQCIPGYGPDQPGFLGPGSLRMKRGYRPRFDPGPPARAKELASRKLSPTSIESYAYWMIPDPPGSGRKAWCGDARGVLCTLPDGSAPPTKGQCPQACEAPK